MVQRQDIEFTVEGDVTLRGWLFVPDGPGPHPGITMAHGFAGVNRQLQKLLNELDDCPGQQREQMS